MKRIILVILTIALITSCAPSPEEEAKAIVEKYVSTLNARDIEGQMEVLDPEAINPEAYKKAFLNHIEKAEILSLEKSYENDIIIIIELRMRLVLVDSFTGNSRLKAGENILTRYFTFTLKDMKLHEILDALIMEDQTDNQEE